MVEEQQKRVEEHTSRILEEIDKSMRKMKGDAYRCAANCCDNETYSIQKIQKCVQNCNQSLDQAQDFARDEIERIQNRLQRCVMDCSDKIKDAAGPNPSQHTIEKYGNQFDKCITNCADNYCNMLPNLEKTVKSILATKFH
ncbi:Protein FAM136A [Habropoda laboriosa]|uniref:Protein FAM136A n=1 Tax=Habropoda laboriosa TaxID=597456 RepID=A0A0L7RCK9_9HYME|nr:PREDICTED: protein FAM136A-like [Habropoda laboriosa]KOC68578.1 Protein FAM136A [Habropoda laboriosa]